MHVVIILNLLLRKRDNYMSTELIKKLSQNRINDGLLKDFIARGLYTAALGEIPHALDKRQKDINILVQLQADLEELAEKEVANHD